MTERIVAVFTAFYHLTGYFGVAFLMGIESACIPLPSEIIMPLAGYLLAAGSTTRLLLIATAGAIGCNVGSIPAYWLGARGGRPAVERFGRFILLSRHDLDRTEHFFNRFGGLTVLVGRLLPVVRTFIALPAGIARMNQFRFHLYTFIGSWPWCFVLALVGVKLGDHWDSNPRFKAIFHRFHLGVELVLVALLLWFITSHWKNRIRSDVA